MFRVIQKLLTQTILLASLLSLFCHSALAQAPKQFYLLSKTFVDGATLGKAQVYTGAGGQNISPELHWGGAPNGTKSYALTCFDPDARKGRGWWHWLLYDIPVSMHELPAGFGTPGTDTNHLSPGLPAINSFGDANYDGPAPPHGDAPHHYVFTIYAIKLVCLPTSSFAPDVVRAEITANSIARATLTGRYGD